MLHTRTLFAIAFTVAATVAATVAMAEPAATATPAAAPLTRIVTGSERGTYIQIGHDLSRWVAQPAGIGLKVMPSNGSTDNIRRLRSEPGVGLALVQSDVYQAFLDEAAAGNTDALRLINPLRVVLPLYDEEVYFIVRADSPMNFMHEVRDKRINVGPIGSGTALSATTIYRAMFGSPMPEKGMSFLGNEEALLKLATDRSIDVVVVVAGQPAKLFSEMKPEARQYIKLLRLDDRAPESVLALQTYFPAAIKAASYPSWLREDVPTLTTKALLVTYDYKPGATQQSLTKFARSLCRNINTLKTEGHAKWQEVSFDMPPLGKGWSYYGATEAALKGCAPAALATAQGGGELIGTNGQAACSQDKKVLGMCRR
jgi:uncharacterized protein